MIDIVDVVQNIDVTFSDDSEIQPIDVIFKDDQSGIVLDFDQYSGFTNNYESLKNKPSIDGVTIIGDMTSADLGLVKSYDDLTDRPSVNGVTLTGDLTSSDLGLVESYDDLQDRPSVNGVTLTGDLTSADLGLVESYDDLTDRPSIDGVTLTGAMTSADLGLVKSYDELQDRPSIDGVTLTGDMTSADLGLVKSYDDLTDKPSVDGVTIEGAMTSADLGIVKSYTGLTDKPSLNGVTIAGAGTNESYGIVLSDTFEHWSEKTNLVGQRSVIYVYTDYQAYDSGTGTTVSYPGVKIGNGRTKLSALPFINAPDPRLLNHIANNSIHVTSEDKANWNGAVTDVSVLKHQIERTMHNIGETTTEIEDGSTTIPILVNGSYVVPSAGDVVRYQDKEFMYTETGVWAELGAVGNRILKGTKEYWNAQPTLISELDTIYIYTNYIRIDNGSDPDTYYQGLKIGDGSAYLIDLPFIGGYEGINITQEDIDRWNSKWRGYLDRNDSENLIFTTD